MTSLSLSAARQHWNAAMPGRPQSNLFLMASSGEDSITYPSSQRPFPSIWLDSFPLHFKSINLYPLAHTAVCSSHTIVHAQLGAVIIPSAPDFSSAVQPIPFLLQKWCYLGLWWLPKLLPELPPTVYYWSAVPKLDTLPADFFPAPGHIRIRIMHVLLFRCPNKTGVFSKQLDISD